MLLEHRLYQQSWNYSLNLSPMIEIKNEHGYEFMKCVVVLVSK